MPLEERAESLFIARTGNNDNFHLGFTVVYHAGSHATPVEALEHGGPCWWLHWLSEQLGKLHVYWHQCVKIASLLHMTQVLHKCQVHSPAKSDSENIHAMQRWPEADGDWRLGLGA